MLPQPLSHQQEWAEAGSSQLVPARFFCRCRPDGRDLTEGQRKQSDRKEALLGGGLEPPAPPFLSFPQQNQRVQLGLLEKGPPETGITDFGGSCDLRVKHERKSRAHAQFLTRYGEQLGGPGCSSL